MATFEYMRIDLNDIDYLNKMGKQGWRVVPVAFPEKYGVTTTINYWVLMEREIQNQSNFNKS